MILTLGVRVGLLRFRKLIYLSLSPSAGNTRATLWRDFAVQQGRATESHLCTDCNAAVQLLRTQGFCHATVSYCKIVFKGVGNGKIDIFEELTPHLRTYKLHGQGEKRGNTKSRQTNTSHCPTKNYLQNRHRPP